MGTNDRSRTVPVSWGRGTGRVVLSPGGVLYQILGAGGEMLQIM